VLCLAKAGRIDPDTGEAAPEHAGAITRVTRLLRRFTSNRVHKDEPAGVRKELSRLAALSAAELSADPSCVAHITLNEISEIESVADPDHRMRRLVFVLGEQRRELAFQNSSAFKADQCYEMLHRILELRAASAC
jgi:hypothetical protein